MSEQKENLARVTASIGSVVLDFCRERLASDPVFHMEDLLSYVRAHAAAAPASPDRILRQLRLDGVISYEVRDRAKSQYEITAIPQAAKAWDSAWSKPAAQKRMF